MALVVDLALVVGLVALVVVGCSVEDLVVGGVTLGSPFVLLVASKR